MRLEGDRTLGEIKIFKMVYLWTLKSSTIKLTSLKKKNLKHLSNYKSKLGVETVWRCSLIRLLLFGEHPVDQLVHEARRFVFSLLWQREPPHKLDLWSAIQRILSGMKTKRTFWQNIKDRNIWWVDLTAARKSQSNE